MGVYSREKKKVLLFRDKRGKGSGIKPNSIYKERTTDVEM